MSRILMSEIRKKFLEYFSRNGHEVVDSSNIVPNNDPTLMFTNSGMVQFKNVFTGLEKKSFKEIFTSQLCLVIADGFYEWKNEFGSKQAFYIYKDDQKPFAFAGLWRTEPGCGHLSPQNESYVIVTRRAVSSINHIHHRMPFILEEEHYETWLKGSVADADSLLNEGYDIELASHQVSDRVGSIKNDDPNLCDKYTPPQLTLF